MISQLPIDEQMETLKRGTFEVIPEDELRAKLEKSRKSGKPMKIKLGLDPTAPDIHIGHAVVLRKMRQFQDLGHEVIIIMGDFTASIGDPSGRAITRPLLTPEEIAANAQTYYEQYCKILDAAKTRVTYNSEWLRTLNFADIVRITAKITVARIIERDDFATRLSEGKPIGLHETLYPVCQAYDSVVLEADVEVGGTEQKFNILMGRDLQREYGQEPQVAMFMPLLVGLDGVQKMSKSLKNYIGVSEPPNEMFGKVMSLADDLMPQYFELATNVPMTEIREIEAGVKAGKLHPMDVKKRLAREIITIYHNADAASEAQSEFERVFSARELPTEIPTSRVILSPAGTVWAPELLVQTGTAGTKNEARRLILGGAVELDGQKITDPNAELRIQPGQVLHVGKRHFRQLEIGPPAGPEMGPQPRGPRRAD